MEARKIGTTEQSKRALSESDSATLDIMSDNEGKRLAQWLVLFAGIVDNALEACTAKCTIAADEITTIYPEITIEYTDYKGAQVTEVHSSLDWRIIADNSMQQARNILANYRLQQHCRPLIGQALTARMNSF